MSWVKVDDAIASHPKVLRAGARLGPNGPMTALGVVLWGLCYANRYLTDGHIPTEAVTTMRGMRRPLETATALVEAGLWEYADGGYQIHDYADYQLAGDALQSRREHRREAGRIGGLRSGRARRSKPEANTKQVASEVAKQQGSKPEASGFRSGEANLNPNPNPNPNPKERENALARETIERRAGSFVAWYMDRYVAIHKSGYYKRPHWDYSHARDLVELYPDDDWLRQMAEVYLLTDHPDAAKSSRTIGQFTVLAGWCDQRLRKAGRKPATEASPTPAAAVTA